MTVILLLALVHSVHASCVNATRIHQLTAILESAETAFEAADRSAFASAAVKAATTLTCLDEG